MRILDGTLYLSRKGDRRGTNGTIAETIPKPSIGFGVSKTRFANRIIGDGWKEEILRVAAPSKRVGESIAGEAAFCFTSPKIRILTQLNLHFHINGII